MFFAFLMEFSSFTNRLCVYARALLLHALRSVRAEIEYNSKLKLIIQQCDVVEVEEEEKEEEKTRNRTLRICYTLSGSNRLTHFNHPECSCSSHIIYLPCNAQCSRHTQTTTKRFRKSSKSASQLRFSNNLNVCVLCAVRARIFDDKRINHFD